MNTNSEFAQTKYGSLKGIYDLLDVFHYGNVSLRSRNALLKYISETPENPLIIGCGTGDFTVEFIRQFHPNYITINDISQKMIDETVSRIKKSSGKENFIFYIVMQRKYQPVNNMILFLLIIYSIYLDPN